MNYEIKLIKKNFREIKRKSRMKYMSGLSKKFFNFQKLIANSMGDLNIQLLFLNYFCLLRSFQKIKAIFMALWLRRLRKFRILKKKYSEKFLNLKNQMKNKNLPLSAFGQFGAHFSIKLNKNEKFLLFGLRSIGGLFFNKIKYKYKLPHYRPLADLGLIFQQIIYKI